MIPKFVNRLKSCNSEQNTTCHDLWKSVHLRQKKLIKDILIHSLSLLHTPLWCTLTSAPQMPQCEYCWNLLGIFFFLQLKRYPKYLGLYLLKAPPHLHASAESRPLTSLWLIESPVLDKILNSDTEEPMTSWSHKYYVLCFPRCCLMFHIEVGTIEQTRAHKRMGPLIPRGIILVEGVFSTGPARRSY